MKFALGFFESTVGAAFPNARKPFIRVKINPNDDANIDWAAVPSYEALVDTGADLCLFDSKLVDPTRLTSVPNIDASSVQTGVNTKRDVKIYRMAVLLPNQATRISLSFVPIDMDLTLPFRWILGMDFLNLCGMHIHRGNHAGYLSFKI